MAIPIKETPILFGEDARRFERLMNEGRKETPEQRERRLRDYEACLRMIAYGDELRKRERVK